jgi:hypothetical protein
MASTSPRMASTAPARLASSCAPRTAASPVAIHVGPSAGAATRASPAPRVTGAAQPVGSRASAHAPSSGEPGEVIARGSHQQPAHVRDRREAVWTPQLWSLGQQLAGARQFVRKRSGGQPVRTPPRLDVADLELRLRRDADGERHCRRRSAMREDTGRSRPAAADSAEAASARCSACLSASVKSSPSSSATKSMTVPSGSVVGSSRTRRGKERCA